MSFGAFAGAIFDGLPYRKVVFTIVIAIGNALEKANILETNEE